MEETEGKQKCMLVVALGIAVFLYLHRGNTDEGSILDEMPPVSYMVAYAVLIYSLRDYLTDDLTIAIVPLLTSQLASFSGFNHIVSGAAAFVAALVVRKVMKPVQS